MSTHSRTTSHEHKPKTSMSLFTSFAERPVNIRFETQEEEEEVILFLRQHVIGNVPWVVTAIFMAIAPTVVFPFVFTFLRLPFTIPVQYIIVGTLFWYLATFGFVLANFIHWFFNIYIVTNQRIVDIDFINLLYKQFSETRLDNIQDITYRRAGIIATIFNYGNVYSQTAGQSPNFEFESVPKPDIVVSTIGNLLPDNPGGV